MQTSSESSDETSHLHGPCCSFASPRPLAFDWRGGVGTEVYAIPQTLPLFEWWEVPAVGLIWVLWVHGKDQRCVSQRVGATLWSKVGLSLAVQFLGSQLLERGTTRAKPQAPVSCSAETMFVHTHHATDTDTLDYIGRIPQTRCGYFGTDVLLRWREAMYPFCFLKNNGAPGREDFGADA